MIRKYIEKLEFNKITENLCNLCITNIGKNFAIELLPRK